MHSFHKGGTLVMTMVERPLAGPGSPVTALNVLARAGWTITNDRKANTFAFPPDRRVLVEFLPEANEFGPNETLWGIRAYDDLHQIVWEATFTSATPAEFIAAFLTDLADPEPLDPDREEDVVPAIAPADNASPTSDEG
ncbi:DUF317 domain-containing protein [Actinomadura soli]|uniref:DUF317 domain-containing protein n=1 Tax=Actinomadura soli TaxID=2508997 RepID=A0A5C4IYL1_9ACTN|nr:DUF317 domain-containing protein [Actinomadura soli]TMQ86136.1 DUF317 domain-containing protein [Actinomadura soli]